MPEADRPPSDKNVNLDVCSRWVRRMAHYRIFSLTKVGERVERSPLIVEHRDDAPAIEAAKQLLDGSNIVEVWEGARLVMRLDSTIAEKRVSAFERARS